MKNLKRLYTTVLIFMFVGFIPPSCCLTTSCGCGDNSLPNFYIKTIELLSTNAANEAIDTSLYYAYTDVFKQVNIAEKEYEALNTVAPSFSFYGSAMACSPAPADALNPITEIKIKAANSFYLVSQQDVIQVGEDITHRFEMRYEWSKTYKAISAFVNDTKDSSYLIKLIDKPLQDTNMVLDISILLLDGTLFEFKGQIMNVN